MTTRNMIRLPWVFETRFFGWCIPETTKVDVGVKRSRNGDASLPAIHLGQNRAVSSAYLRAAQAYMLISMPTGTSTIFGAFQAI
jgi:hypothetical protein